MQPYGRWGIGPTLCSHTLSVFTGNRTQTMAAVGSWPRYGPCQQPSPGHHHGPSLHLHTFTFLDLSLSTGHEPFCLSLPYFTMYLFTLIVSDLAALGRFMFLLPVHGKQPWEAMWVFFSYSVLIQMLVYFIYTILYARIVKCSIRNSYFKVSIHSELCSEIHSNLLSAI